MFAVDADGWHFETDEDARRHDAALEAAIEARDAEHEAELEIHIKGGQEALQCVVDENNAIAAEVKRLRSALEQALDRVDTLGLVGVAAEIRRALSPATPVPALPVSVLGPDPFPSRGIWGGVIDPNEPALASPTSEGGSAAGPPRDALPPFVCCDECKTETACVYARDCNFCELAASQIPGFGTDQDKHRCPKFHRDKPRPTPEPCGTCGGSSVIGATGRLEGCQITSSAPCPACGGTGRSTGDER